MRLAVTLSSSAALDQLSFRVGPLIFLVLSPFINQITMAATAT
jgi:hypothetical protein